MLQNTSSIQGSISSSPVVSTLFLPCEDRRETILLCVGRDKAGTSCLGLGPRVDQSLEVELGVFWVGDHCIKRGLFGGESVHGRVERKAREATGSNVIKSRVYQ
jgi:hypothetical protein